MAKARRIVGDQNSAEIDHLKKTVNTLLKMLETAGASIAAGASAEDVLSAWAAGVAEGKDSNPDGIANVESTGLEISGIKTIVQFPRRPGDQAPLVELD